jgi:hypothetical protein
MTRDYLNWDLRVAKRKLGKVCMPYRSALKQGYQPTRTDFDALQGYGNHWDGLVGQVRLAKEIVAYVDAQRAGGRDVVAVVHGMHHPHPDTVRTVIYERPAMVPNWSI